MTRRRTKTEKESEEEKKKAVCEMSCDASTGKGA